GQYFSGFSSILIVYNNSGNATPLQVDYLSALELVLRDLRQPIRLQWINVALLKDLTALEDQVMGALNSSVTEGFITILSKTDHFLHARYYATRNANVRLKDKRYLFLCEDESPAEFLSMDILQEGAAVNTRNKDDGVARLAGTTTTSPYRDINFELWTQKFVGAFGNLDALLLDAFLPNQTFAKRVELYPNKLLNLQRRSLLPAGQGDVDPIHPAKANRSVTFDGAEANVMKTFCQVHNCHLRVEAYGADNWGGIYDNESSDGMLGDIYEQRVEMAIGCIYNWYDGITETSHTIARSSVTILGPGPDFDRFAPRFFLATLLCATITLENIYSGQLKSILTFPFYCAPVDTIEKWAQSQWKWAAPSIIWVQTVQSSDLETEQILARNFEFIDKYMDKKKQEVLMDLANGHKVKGAPQALDVDNIAGALFVLAFGLTFAGCALVIELLIHRMEIGK
ncbi:hypothetical protein M5D96_002772, partial [Drosophila gunungcola]